jgi:lipoprotein-anchoring transpeptidase ErfK/SrfK
MHFVFLEKATKKESKMKKLALALAASGLFALCVPSQPANATFESADAKSAAADAAELARQDMYEAFGEKRLKPGQYLWRDVDGTGPARVVVSLSDQLAFLYKGDTLVAVSTISSGTKKNPTPTGIFPILEKKKFHRSRKYENAPMPFMQRLDKYGVALHGGHLPGYPASHGCIRLPSQFAAKLFAVTDVGTPVLVGAS